MIIIFSLIIQKAQLLKQKVDKVNSALNKKIKAVQKMKQKNQNRLQTYEKVKKKELEKLEKEFKKLLTNLKDRKLRLKKEFLQFYEEETKGLLSNIDTQEKIIKDLNKNMKALKKLSNELSMVNLFFNNVLNRKDKSFKGEEIRVRGG